MMELYEGKISANILKLFLHEIDFAPAKLVKEFALGLFR